MSEMTDLIEMKKTQRRVLVVVTARPSYSRIRTALAAIQEHPDLELLVVVAASALLDRYGTTVDTIEGDGFEVAAKLYTVVEGENPEVMVKTTGLGLIELSTTLQRLAPDLVVTIADRYETMATAITASYMNRPLVHIQGGEVTGSIDEKVRHAITKLADLHLVSTDKAKERVERMGEREGAIVVTGCPSIDLAAEVATSPALDFDPIGKYGGVGHALDLSKGYLVVLQHPVTTEFENAREHAAETLEAIHRLALPTLWFWPNPDAGSDGTSSAIRSFRERFDPPNIHFFKNVAPKDFLRLLLNSRCLVGNSSAGIRECSFLGVPAVNIGSRQAGRERGANVLDVAPQRDAIVEAVRRHIEHGPYPSTPVYGQGNAGERIAEAIANWQPTIAKRLTY